MVSRKFAKKKGAVLENELKFSVTLIKPPFLYSFAYSATALIKMKCLHALNIMC